MFLDRKNALSHSLYNKHSLQSMKPREVRLPLNHDRWFITHTHTRLHTSFACTKEKWAGCGWLGLKEEWWHVRHSHTLLTWQVFVRVIALRGMAGRASFMTRLHSEEFGWCQHCVNGWQREKRWMVTILPWGLIALVHNSLQYEQAVVYWRLKIMGKIWCRSYTSFCTYFYKRQETSCRSSEVTEDFVFS